MVNELSFQCVLPAGEYDGASISVTDGGGTAVASLGGGPGDGGGDGSEPGGGGGDGSGPGGGSDTDDTATGELPATGSRGVVFIAASLAVVAGLLVRRIGQHRSLGSS